MKVIYLTSKTFPSTTADHLFIKYAAEAFARSLGSAFTLLVVGMIPDELQRINTISAPAPRSFRSFFYFFWLPLFVLRGKYNTKETMFFSNDFYLLSILVFWKKLFRFTYSVCSEWHMLFNDYRDLYIARNSEYLVATSEHLKRLIVDKSRINGSKVLVAYGGIDMELFKKLPETRTDLRIRLGLPQSNVLVGYVGTYKTMGMAKGLETMIRALTLIQDAGVKIALVGGKSFEIEEYKRVAEDLGVSGRTVFVPSYDPAMCSAYEQAMDMLVIPYPDEPHFRDYGFPMKAYEYMTSERPILYSDLPIISEVLGDCAVSFQPGDAKDLAEKILQVKSDPHKSEETANRAYGKVVNYTWDKRTANIIAFLQGI